MRISPTCMRGRMILLVWGGGGTLCTGLEFEDGRVLLPAPWFPPPFTWDRKKCEINCSLFSARKRPSSLCCQILMASLFWRNWKARNPSASECFVRATCVFHPFSLLEKLNIIFYPLLSTIKYKTILEHMLTSVCCRLSTTISRSFAYRAPACKV